MRTARTCYDHLAGQVAVSLALSLEEHGVRAVRDAGNYQISTAGRRWFAEVLQVDVAALEAGRRALATRCMDWTERRPHVAGALGAARLGRLLASRWIAMISGSRAVRLTPRGRLALAEVFSHAHVRAAAEP